MDIIIQIADSFSKRHLRSLTKPDECIESARNEAEKIYDPLDKTKFLQFIIDKNREFADNHRKGCRHGENCLTITNYKKVDYFLCQELKFLGAHKFEDTFSKEEIQNLNEKLDRIQSNLEIIKDGQKITYEDVSEELSELKNLYFLGKKKWYQIWLGKICEMTIAGIISDTASKQMLDLIKETHKAISNQ
jgi:hypothetical protein